MGLDKPPTATDESTLERSKVVQALYIRDNRLCISRGTPSWFPSMKYTSQSQPNAMDSESPYESHLRLAMIQNDIYTQSNVAEAIDVRNVEQQLNQYMNKYQLLHRPLPSIVSQPVQVLESLATRILAFYHAPDVYAVRARSDARASCLLVLMSYGDKGQDVTDAFRKLVPAADDEMGLDTSSNTFFTALDAFSIPGVFILLRGLMQMNDAQPEFTIISDLDLLHRLSACYTEQTQRMPSTHYHRKVSWILDQLLLVIDMIQHPQGASISDPADSFGLARDSSGVIGQNIESGLGTHWVPRASSTASLTWDTWLSSTSPLGQSSLGPPTPIDPTRVASPDLLTQMLAVSQGLDGTQDLPWSTLPEASGHKRRRTEKDQVLSRSEGFE